jgi:hypothetical protein
MISRLTSESFIKELDNVLKSLPDFTSLIEEITIVCRVVRNQIRAIKKIICFPVFRNRKILLGITVESVALWMMV